MFLISWLCQVIMWARAFSFIFLCLYIRLLELFFCLQHGNVSSARAGTVFFSSFTIFPVPRTALNSSQRLKKILKNEGLPANLMYSMVTMVNNTVLCTWKLLREEFKRSHLKKSMLLCEIMGNIETYLGNHFTVHTYMKSLCCIPETCNVLCPIISQ